MGTANRPFRVGLLIGMLLATPVLAQQPVPPRSAVLNAQPAPQSKAPPVPTLAEPVEIHRHGVRPILARPSWASDPVEAYTLAMEHATGDPMVRLRLAGPLDLDGVWGDVTDESGLIEIGWFHFQPMWLSDDIDGFTGWVGIIEGDAGTAYACGVITDGWVIPLTTCESRHRAEQVWEEHLRVLAELDGLEPRVTNCALGTTLSNEHRGLAGRDYESCRDYIQDQIQFVIATCSVGLGVCTLSCLFPPACAGCWAGLVTACGGLLICLNYNLDAIRSEYLRTLDCICVEQGAEEAGFNPAYLGCRMPSCPDCIPFN